MKRAVLLSLLLALTSGQGWSGETKPGPEPGLKNAACELPEAAKPGKPDRLPAETLAEANSLYDQEKWAEARDAYLQYLASSPDDLDARTDLGVTLRELGEQEKALKQFDCVLARDSGHWKTLYNKIILVGFDLDRRPEAEQLLVKLRELQPGNADVEALAKALKEQ
jgi:tetratricopeptide (TPR) repeat protein